MNKTKKILTSVLAISLVAVIAVGGTLAYLFTKTDTKTNVFTFADNIKADLDEPNWDPDEAENLVPGKEVAKDPQITNTSENGVDEYAAIKLTFTRGDGTTVLTDAEVATLMNYITIDWSSNWTLINGTATSGKQIYQFNEILNQGVTSDPVFYSVTINEDITPEQLKWLAGDYGHTDDCYEFAACDCTKTYKHHERCALKAAQEAGKLTAEQVNAAQAGATVRGNDGHDYTCDCTPSVVHASTCASLVGTLKDNCGHTALASGIGNFNIKVEGAAVQADAFDSAADAKTDLISLFA